MSAVFLAERVPHRSEARIRCDDAAGTGQCAEAVLTIFGVGRRRGSDGHAQELRKGCSA